MLPKSRRSSGSFSLTASPRVVCRDCRCSRPMRMPARLPSCRSRSVMSTNSVARFVSKRRRCPTMRSTSGRGARARAWAGLPRRMPPPPTSPRSPAQRRSGRPGWRRRPGFSRSVPGRGRPSGGWAGWPPDPRGPAAGSRPRRALPPGPAWAGLRAPAQRPRPGTTGKSPRGRPPRGSRAGRARGRGAEPTSDGLHERTGQLPEGRHRLEAGFVVSRHDVVKAETQDRIQDEGNQDVAGDGEADPAVLLQPVELRLDDLAGPGVELGQVRPQALGARRLAQEVGSGQLVVAQLSHRIPEPLKSDLEALADGRALSNRAPQLVSATV